MLDMFWNALFIALREIRRNLTRAFLTVLGIIIGVAAVITMVTLGEGTSEVVRNQISSLGSNLLIMRPGMGYGPRVSRAGVPNFKENDASAIQEQVPGVQATAPVRTSGLNTIYMRNARNSPVVGSTTAFFSINRWSIAEGRFFSEEDELFSNAVCVIGNTVRKELFGNEDPIGKKIRIGKASCEVIGLLKGKGQSGMNDQDDTIIVPLTTLQRRLIGKKSDRDITQIHIQAIEGVNSDRLINEISSLMRSRRGLNNSQPDDFRIWDTRQLIEMIDASNKAMTTLLAAVAGVSLLVGGIGIMNIMLVSVTERTREIGIRMAIGARSREVLLQFLVEAIALSCIGGLIGVLTALGLTFWLAKVIEVPFLFNLEINVIAFLFSAIVGVLFGFTPARRAAKLNPIDALRYE